MGSKSSNAYTHTEAGRLCAVVWSSMAKAHHDTLRIASENLAMHVYNCIYMYILPSHVWSCAQLGGIFRLLPTSVAEVAKQHTC